MTAEAKPQPLHRTICKIVHPENLEETKAKLKWLGYKIRLITKTQDGDYVVQATEKTSRVARRAICEC